MKIRWFAVTLMGLLPLAGAAVAETLALPGPGVATAVTVTVFLPPGYADDEGRRYPLLLVNDGQDAEAVALAETVSTLIAGGQIVPVIVAAVPMPADRMAAYGFSDRKRAHSLPAQTRFGPIGLQAQDYSEWVVKSLIPAIDARYRTRREASARGILGWSLGAVSAFNLAWGYPEQIGQVGAFSPSFWLSAVAEKPETAIAPALIARESAPDRFKMYIAVGGAEEHDDRDGDGIIDVVDDAQGVYRQLVARYGAKAIALRICKDGQHNPATWKRMLPDFLRWAYPVAVLKEK